jgi:RNA polymerase sigma-70 factor (ECF subfamily)
MENVVTSIRAAVSRSSIDPESFQAGNRDRFFRTLVGEHQRRLYRLILRRVGNPTEAEEIAQNTFAEAVTSITRFRGESELFSWLAGIAMNMVRNHLSRSPHRKYTFADESALDEIAGEHGDPYSQVQQTQLLRMVQEQMELLHPDMRNALVLVAIDDISYEDAATALRIPIGTVRSRVSRARGVLRTRLKEVGIDSPV